MCGLIVVVFPNVGFKHAIIWVSKSIPSIEQLSPACTKHVIQSMICIEYEAVFSAQSAAIVFILLYFSFKRARAGSWWCNRRRRVISNSQPSKWMSIAGRTAAASIYSYARDFLGENSFSYYRPFIAIFGRAPVSKINTSYYSLQISSAETRITFSARPKKYGFQTHMLSFRSYRVQLGTKRGPKK